MALDEFGRTIIDTTDRYYVRDLVKSCNFSSNTINCGDVYSLAINGTLTFAFFAKIRDNDNKNFFSKQNHTGSFKGYHWGPLSSNRLTFEYIGDTGSLSSTTSSNVYTLNKWHHFIFTYANKRIIVYVDGVKKTDTTPGNTLTVASTEARNFHIGSRNGQGFQSYIGHMDDFRVYDSILSDANAKLLAKNYEIDVPSLSHWKMDEGTGTLAEDSGSNGYDGTLSSASMWSTDIYKTDRTAV